MQYNIPRLPVERTEDLTEYEFEYELILRHEYYEYLKDLRSSDSIDMAKGGVDREIRADPEVYEALKKKIEAGEPLDFKLPDATNLPRMSQILAGRQQEEAEQPDFEPVRPEDVFDRVFGGGR